jgi:hypothetical protein
MLDCTTNIGRIRATSVTDDRASAATNFIGQTILQNNVTSSQSSDIKDIRKLISEEVQLLKSMSQEFSRTTTQSQFAALGIFLLGISLIIYGLRLVELAQKRSPVFDTFSHPTPVQVSLQE